MSTHFDEELDASGLSCPMPILKLSKVIKKLDKGKVIKMIGTDPGSLDDVPKFCKRKNCELLSTGETEDGKYLYFIKK